MLRNYFKTAWRNITASKGYSALNVMGLATGMAVALIIGLWVHNEFSFDKFLAESERAYRVQRNFDSNGDTLTFRTTSLKLANTLRTEVPEIEYVAESDWMGQHGLVVGDKKLYLNGGQVGSDFLKIFRYPLVKGNPGAVLNDPYSIVITESLAKSLFGDDDPIGKVVRFDNKDNLKVSGVLREIPDNASMKFSFLVPFSYMEQTNERVKSNRSGSYGNNGYQTFVKLKPNVTMAQANARVRNIEHTEKDNTNAMKSYVTFQPLSRWHLYSNYVNGQDKAGFLEYVKMFAIIGSLVLLIACINFINLATARSEKRAREVGVRKAIGSGRQQLILQFLVESFIFTLIAFLLAMLLVTLSLGSFNTLTEGKLEIPFANPVFWAICLIAVVITSILAGGRPALYMSSLQPVQVLKGGTASTGKGASLPRKILVVLQFSCSVALIISTIIIYKQIQYARERPTGLEVDRLMMTNMNDDLNKNYEALKNDMLSQKLVTSVTTATSPATDIYWHSDLERWPGKNAGETVEMGTVIVTPDYFKTLGMPIVEGRDFTNQYDSMSVIFNETAIKRLRIKNPIGQEVRWGDTNVKIVGVVRDALMISPFAPPDPTMFYVAERAQSNLMYRLDPKLNTADAIAKLTAVFAKYNPAFPYTYRFADQEYDQKFKSEVTVGKLSGTFAALAIFISCLGLFGLAAYLAEKRTKEIGIRKVLGASVPQMWALLSKESILLVMISCLIASPLAYYFLSDWLLKYEYRINISAGVFVLAALMAIVITIATVSYHAVRAALANPTKSLRSE